MQRPIQEYLGLLSHTNMERLPAVVGFKQELAASLPDYFTAPRITAAPPNSEKFLSVLRADCAHPECSVRAIVHIWRDENKQLSIKERAENGSIQPDFDRTTKICSDCRKMLVSQMRAVAA